MFDFLSDPKVIQQFDSIQSEFFFATGESFYSLTSSACLWAFFWSPAKRAVSVPFPAG